MRYADYSDLPVSEIMRRWPSTIGVFIDYGMHCIGCPIGMFHTLVDAAYEHGLTADALAAEIGAAIAADATAGPARVRRRSASAGADP